MNTAFRHIRSTVVRGLCILGMVALCGCASTRPMALEGRSKALDLEAESIGIFTLRTSNEYKPGFVPAVSSIAIAPEGTKKAVYFQVRGAHSREEGQSLEYLVSVSLPPGRYTVGDVTGLSHKVLIMGSFQFPIEATFELAPNAVAYLGHVSMVNRKRKEGERRSGSVIPLVDQAVSGYSGGTFHITISDRSESDIPLFKQTYRVLQECTITKAIMTR